MNDVMNAMRLHRNVAWIAKYASCTILGQPDMTGQMKDGRMLAVVVGNATPVQGEFLAMVTKYNGVAGVVHSVDEAINLVG